MSRILLIDRHGVYRKGLRLALQIHFPGSQILEAENLHDARKELDPDGVLDLVLVDADEPDTSLDVLRSLRQSHPRTRLVALSATTNRAAILESLQNGLFGFISKSQSDDEILSAIKDILSGRIYVPFILSQLNEASAVPAAAHNGVTGNLLHDREAHPERLTPRQRQILPLLAKGLSNKEIARALKIAEGTTKIHASGLLRVLGVRNRTEAAVAARDYILSEQTAPSRSSKPAEKELCTGPRQR
jgi:DNA-binding NarL/FixJ family response regulator